MTGAMCLLSRKGFSMPLRLVICGFLHILYWDHAVAYALTLILGHSSLCPCDVASLDVGAWCIALKWVGAKVEEKFHNLRVHKSKLILKPSKPNSGAVFATRNPSCWNRKSDTDWRLLLADLGANRWLPFCMKLAEDLSNRAFSYKDQLDELLRYKGLYYTGKHDAYISIHFMRCMSLATNERCDDLDSDWSILKNMGSGVRHFKYGATRARELLEAIRAAPGAGSVHMDDLACFMCLSH